MTAGPSAPRRGTPLGWFVLLVAGQGASLSLILSGKDVWYPHYQPARLVHWPHAAATAVLLVQLAAVAWGMRGRWAAALAWLRGLAPAGMLLAGGLFLAGLSAVASRDPRAYAGELLLSTALQLLSLATATLLAASLGDAAAGRVAGRLTRLLGGEDGPSPGRFLDPFAVSCGLAVVAACTLLAFVAYEAVPHLPDEIVYLFHARYLARGLLQLPAPPVPAAFDVDLVYFDDTRMFSPVPPGWPAILALGVRVGAPWLVNPILSGVCILLVHALMRRLDTPRTARLATLLLAVSPWFLFLGMSLMTHTATLACALAAALGIALARERQVLLPAALAGVATGVVGLIRPLEGVAVALVMGVWSLGARHRWFRLLPSAVLTVVTVATAALTLPYNAALTGSAKRFPIMMYVDKYYAPGANDMGFGPNRGMGWGGLDPWPGHGLRDVVLNSLLNGAALDYELLGWACGSLVLIVALLCSRRLRALDVAMLAVIALVVGLHAFYWFSGGPDFAARYWFLIVVPCLVLVARAPGALFGRATPSAARATVAMLALSASAMLTWMPWRAVDKYHGYRFMSGDMRAFAASHHWGRALVLVRGRRHPDYHMASLENPLDLADTSRTVYAWDRSADVRRAAVAAYPDRPVYIIDGPTVTGDGFRIAAGPLPPGSLAPDVPSSDEVPSIRRREAQLEAQLEAQREAQRQLQRGLSQGAAGRAQGSAAVSAAASSAAGAAGSTAGSAAVSAAVSAAGSTAGRTAGSAAGHAPQRGGT